MAGAEGAEYRFWSADGRSLGFFAMGKLYRLDIAGGSPQPLSTREQHYAVARDGKFPIKQTVTMLSLRRSRW